MSLFGAGSSRTAVPTVVTYRHLLSPASLTVFNPLRTIAHCDIDAAYAQFEQVRLGLPDDIPLICAQWQSIIAVNYPARKYGIKRFNTIDEAKKMCPHLTVQHVATYRNGEAEAGYWGEVDPRTHKVSLDVYRRESLKILAIFKEMITKGEIGELVVGVMADQVEKASIDEAFLDLSPMVIDKLLEYHPHLATVPEDAPEGLDAALPQPPPIEWKKAGNVVPIDGDKPDGAEAEGEGPEVSQNQDTWEDWALFVGAEIMADLRAEVYKKLHYTCSAGIAHNKAMAKLCSAWKKPNNQTVLRSPAVPAFLRDMEFTDIRMLGGKLGTSIANEFNVKTVGDLLTVPLEELQMRFGEESIWVYNIARGIDHSEVTARVATKSMLASKNTRPPVTTPEQGLHWIKILGGELFVRLRESREVAPGIWPKTLVLGIRTGIEPSKHRQIPFPFTSRLSTEYIVKFAQRLWEEMCQPMTRGGMKLNNMSLSFTGLERMEEGQRGIEGFFSAGNTASGSNAVSPSKLAASKRSRSTSPLPSRYASTVDSTHNAKRRLPTLHTGKTRNPLAGFLVKNGESSGSASISPAGQAVEDASRRAEREAVDMTVISDEEDEQSGSTGSVVPGTWKCPKCGVLLASPAGISENVSAKLEELKREHEDYHFALTLQNGSSPSTSTSKKKARPSGGKDPGGDSRVDKRKKAKKPEGIKAFFAPKPIAKK